MNFEALLCVSEADKLPFTCLTYISWRQTQTSGRVFCKKTGVSSQSSNRNNQASNDINERMDRVFKWSNFEFWGNADGNAAQILYRSPTKTNEGGISPFELLTKK